MELAVNDDNPNSNTSENRPTVETLNDLEVVSFYFKNFQSVFMEPAKNDENRTTNTSENRPTAATLNDGEMFHFW